MIANENKVNHLKHFLKKLTLNRKNLIRNLNKFKNLLSFAIIFSLRLPEKYETLKGSEIKSIGKSLLCALQKTPNKSNPKKQYLSK